MRWLGLVFVVGCGHDDCVPLVDGDWTVDGAAFGMQMGGVVTMDRQGCTFTLGDWNMEMLSLPEGGSVDQDQVTMDGDSFWRSCTGTVDSDGTSVHGECEDGDAFTMTQGAAIP